MQYEQTPPFCFEAMKLRWRWRLDLRRHSEGASDCDAVVVLEQA